MLGPEMGNYVVVTTADKDNSKNGNADSKIFKLDPYKGSWDACLLRPSNGPEELQLLRDLQAHKKLLESGVLEVDYTDPEGGENEAAAEEAAYDPNVNPEDF